MKNKNNNDNYKPLIFVKEYIKYVEDWCISHNVTIDDFMRYDKPLNMLMSEYLNGDDLFSTSGQYISNILIASEIVYLWKDNKQLYSFEKDFTDLLINIPVENIKMNKELFKLLPYNTICIEFEDNEFGFVSVKYDSSFNMANVAFVIIDTWNPFTFPSLKTRNICIKFYDESKSVTDHIEDIKPAALKKKFEKLIHCMLYLIAQNSIVEENEYQKKIYKKRSKVKNTITEVRKWDCGIRRRKVYPKKPLNDEYVINEENDESVKETTIRKKMRYCMVKAHYQHYHVGPGRKETILKLKLPYEKGIKYEDCPIVINEMVIEKEVTNYD